MIKVAIVEDEKNVADILSEYVYNFSKEKNIDVEVKWFPDAVKLIETYNYEFNVILMDIEMPKLDGMSAVKKIREFDKQVLVIFVTNLARYAVKGYEVNALDFIVKPITYPDFSLKFLRVIEKLNSFSNDDIWVSTYHGKKMIEKKKIMYIEVMQHVITYHTTEGEVICSGTLKKEREKLGDSRFVLCNQCYLVNLHYVNEVSDNIVIVGNEKLQISLSKKVAFLRALNNYLCVGQVKEK